MSARPRASSPRGGGRTIFALPWYGRTLIGTTDNDYDGDIDQVQPGRDDVDYLLDAVNSYFGTELDRSVLTGAYAGVRPLISTGDPKKSVDISRKAELYETSSGLLTITGQTRLLEKNPALEASIRLRLPYIEPLNLLQIELMKRHRAGETDPRIAEGIQLTINAIATALRNSG